MPFSMRGPSRSSTLRSDVPAELEWIVQRALDKDLQSRYRSAHEVLKDLADYQASIVAPAVGVGGGGLLGWIKQKRVAIPVLLTLLVLGSLLGWFLHRQAKVHWAREQALPEINRLIDETKFAAAFALARQAEKYIPADPNLLKLWPAMSGWISVHTTPPAARVYLKEYTAVQSDWMYLGRSPIEKVRIPAGVFRWKIEKEGFTTIEDVGGAANAYFSGFPWSFRQQRLKTVSYVLDPQGSPPPGMVRVSGVPGFERLEPVQLPDYWMDKYEVTNKQFKEFVDGGGYRKQEYWKHHFLKGGPGLSWEEAMAELHDATGRPGQRPGELGCLSAGAG